MSDPRVSVVVVTWNGLALTRRCVESLRAQSLEPGEMEIIVVDNGSSDGTVEALSSEPDLRVVPRAVNGGFAAGANAGIRAASGELVVLINNDAVAEPGTVAHLVAPFAAGRRVGATTGTVLLSGRFAPAPAGSTGALVSSDGSRWLRTAQGGTRLLNSTGNEVTRSGNGRDRDWLAPADAPPAPAEVFGFNGGCVALSRAALDDVGLLEESLFMYYEDTELSWRLRRRGWSIEHVPSAVTVHDHAASSGTASAFFQDHNERNRVLVALVHAPWPVVLRATTRTLVRTVLGPERGRRLRVIGSILRRVPWALRRRREVDRSASVPRDVPAALLVPDGGGR
ncbi:glycosyltransferase family 2 protein [Actinotalea sp.]|uniref:glycosyltransferase family 2 protein n=1 Tax=Actinotalea sp. TaxID=1872145 RepID=UPI003569F0EA